MLVVVDEPKGLAWGGSVAAPVFHRVAEQARWYMHGIRETAEDNDYGRK